MSVDTWMIEQFETLPHLVIEQFETLPHLVVMVAKQKYCIIIVTTYIIKQVTVCVTFPVGQSAWELRAELICS